MLAAAAAEKNVLTLVARNANCILQYTSSFVCPWMCHALVIVINAASHLAAGCLEELTRNHSSLPNFGQESSSLVTQPSCA